MRTHDVAFLLIADDRDIFGIGEIAPIPKLSVETLESSIHQFTQIEQLKFDHLESFTNWFQEKDDLTSSLRFACETALEDLKNLGNFQPFLKDTQTKKLKINGLVWMNEYDEMKKQAFEKINKGFDCIKLKVGAINLNDEERLLAELREKHPEITLRIDANGAWKLPQALEILKRWAKYNIHSIEQPIYTHDLNELKTLCKESAIEVALDEQLIPPHTKEQKIELLETVKPQHLVFKPGLIGGFAQTQEWIDLANEYGINWWITSALESNLGMNAIYRFAIKNHINGQIHGLGTGELYDNNWNSPLEIEEGFLKFNPEKLWDDWNWLK
ncbi:MAG: o-succinylbenzoate synthase [Cytophagales bacterium]